MLLYPSQDNLLEKIDSKYSLVILASKRAQQLRDGATPMLSEYKAHTNVGRALEEIEAGDLIIDPQSSKLTNEE